MGLRELPLHQAETTKFQVRIFWTVYQQDKISSQAAKLTFISCIWSKPKYESDRRHTWNVYIPVHRGAVKRSWISSVFTSEVT